MFSPDPVCASPWSCLRRKPRIQASGHARAIAPAQRRRAGGNDGRAGAHDGSLAAFRFFLEWLRNPADTAAIAPSGKALAALITSAVEEQVGPVLELGPGTGVFTQRLIRRGIAERDLTLVEQNPSFARLLRQRFPEACILRIDAADLNHSRGPQAPAFGAAVCGLGLRNMDASKIEGIIGAAFMNMTPAASLYLFTYGWRCSIPPAVLDRLGLVAERIGNTFRNVPPASVYRVSRRTAAR